MSQHIQELIDKIKSEGIQVADKKAGEIESSAQKEAQGIISDAQKESECIISQANTQAQKTHDATQAALKQSARDMILDLRKEIQRILNTIITQQVKDALDTQHVADIIAQSVKDYFQGKPANNDVIITLNDKDLKKIKEGFIAKLQNTLKEGIDFKPSDDIAKGFTISFDSGKSSFDFTDTSLAEYLAVYLNEEISALICKATGSKEDK